MDKHKITKWFVIPMLFIIGSLLIGGGGYGISFLRKVERQYIQVTARIEKIKERTEYQQWKRRVHHDVTISFHANNTTYRVPLNSYNPFMNEGDDIVVRYNPEKPNEVYSVINEKILYIALLLAGVVFLVIDWYAFRIFFKKKTDRYLKTGIP